ncbi:CRE-KEL-1 protein [Caenorhabditis remanei]|uniref:CRE-KEL-1 protein n=1 Tax=Caenorhabditis remanei TaxID=31234 RepID=E3LFX4_CAERE|nr:CRE-KEL-1 protein [Caenorhabditis remanei]
MLPNIYNVESDTLGVGLLHGSSRSPSFNKTSTYTNPTMLSDFYQNLNAMRCQQELCDVILEAYQIQGTSSEDGIIDESNGPQHIHAHRVILSASSSYFRAMFTGGLRESQQRIVPIKEVDVEVLSQLIDYMYTGRMRIDEQNVQTILTTASLLQLTCVRDACARFMLELLDMTNCVGMAEFARAHACHQLAHAAQLYTRQHFVEIIDNEELLNLDKEAFCDLIQDDRITVPSEKPVMQAVLNWVNHDEQNRKVHLGELMSNVRLPLLGDDYLLEKCRNDDTIKRDVACLNVIIEGIHQLKVTKERQSDMSYLSSEDRNPREEVNRKWFIAREPMPESQHIMVVGGQAPKAITNVDLFDPDSQLWSSCASLPQRRCRSGVSMCNGYVYTTGGFNGAQRVKSVDFYDPRTDTWRSANQMNARRSTHGITTCQKLLYAVGGFDGTTGLASSEYYDPHTGNWFPLPSMSTRRSSVGVAAIGEDIYAIGGFDGVSKQCLNTVCILTIFYFDEREKHNHKADFGGNGRK